MQKTQQGSLFEQILKRLSLPILRNVYLTKFESILKYGIIFWGGGLRTLILFLSTEKMSKSD
jgi:hypothetical protein